MVNKIHLSEGIASYLDFRTVRYAKSTVHADLYILRRFQRQVGNLYVSSLTPEHVAGFFETLLREHRTSDGVTRPMTDVTGRPRGGDGRPLRL